MAIVLEDPESKSGKPIIKIAIQNELCVMRCANPTHEGLKLLLVNYVTPDRIVNVALPPYQVCAGHMPLLVCIFRIIVNFQNPNVWVIKVLRNPFGLA